MTLRLSWGRTQLDQDLERKRGKANLEIQLFIFLLHSPLTQTLEWFSRR